MIGTFGLNMEPTDEQREYIEETNKIFNRAGITIDLETNGNSHVLAIFYEPDEVKKKLGHGGGRKRKPLTKLITVGEVKELNKTMGFDRIAADLGISGTALKKRVYAAKSDDEFI